MRTRAIGVWFKMRVSVGISKVIVRMRCKLRKDLSEAKRGPEM